MQRTHCISEHAAGLDHSDSDTANRRAENQIQNRNRWRRLPPLR